MILLRIWGFILVTLFLFSCGQAKKEKENLDFMLLIACRNGNTKDVESLLKKGANVHYRISLSKDTPLHEASNMMYIVEDINGTLCSRKKDLSIIKLLIDNGAYIDAVNFYGKTPMMKAIDNENIKLIKFLLENGADVNFGTRSGGYPLKNAIDNSYNDIAQLLISHKAKLDNSLLYQTVIREENTEQELFDYLGSIQLLINSGADVNAIDPVTGETPLIAAVRLKRIDVARLLLKNNANKNLKNHSNLTALNIAKKNGLSEIVKILKKN
jgi:ankyrin repeat protein